MYYLSDTKYPHGQSGVTAGQPVSVVILCMKHDSLSSEESARAQNLKLCGKSDAGERTKARLSGCSGESDAEQCCL